MKILIHPYARKRYMLSRPLTSTGRVMDSNRQYAPLIGKVEGHWLQVSTAFSNGFAVHPIPGVTDDGIGLHIPTVCVGAIEDDIRDHPTHRAIEWVKENLGLWDAKTVLDQRVTEEWVHVWESLSPEEHANRHYKVDDVIRKRESENGDGWEYEIYTYKRFTMPINENDMASDTMTLGEVGDIAIQRFGMEVNRDMVIKAISGRAGIKRPYEPLWDHDVCKRKMRFDVKPVQRRYKLEELKSEGVTTLPQNPSDFPEMHQVPYPPDETNPRKHSAIR